ncbi:MAG: transglycosylase SLT domain-containing protein, partial [Silvanigrellaceae bacterium]|nr:transglycosylase SLT domain-containing protein [Silvanigrellaceae bacterium]
HHLVKIYRDNLLLATAAYNAGPVAVNRWISQNPSLSLDEFYENIPYEETKKYVSKVLSVLDIYHQFQIGNDVSLNHIFSDRLPKPNLSLEIF